MSLVCTPFSGGRFCGSCLFLAISLTSIEVKAVSLQGRFSTGALYSIEDFQKDSAEGKTNDASIFTARQHLQVRSITNRSLIFTFDARQKHNAFGIVDKEASRLEGATEVGITQLSLMAPVRYNSFFYSLGRFRGIDGNSLYVDGVEGGRSFGSVDVGVFGGFNPHPLGSRLFQLNDKTTLVGAFVNYGNHPMQGKQTFKNSFALVSDQGEFERSPRTIEEKDGNESESLRVQYERSYLYNSSSMLWGSRARLFSIIYFDFQPRTSLQSAWLHYTRRLHKKVNFYSTLTKIDSFEYERNQDPLEDLEPSSYSQIKAKVNYAPTYKLSFELGGKYGTRTVDDLDRYEIFTGSYLRKYFSKRLDFSGFLGARKNFIYDELFVRLGVGYYTSRYELTLDQELIDKTSSQDQSKSTPLITELAGSFIFSQQLFGTLAAQWVQDGNVAIQTFLMRVGYRFGSAKIAPIRDGAPPRGKI